MSGKNSTMWNSLSSMVIISCGCAAFIIAVIACVFISKTTNRYDYTA